MLIFSRLVAKKWEKHNYSKRSCWAGCSVFLPSILLFDESYEINSNSEIFVNHGSNKYVKIWQPRKKLNGKRADLDTWLRMLKNCLLGINGHPQITQKDFSNYYEIDEDTVFRMKKLLTDLGELEVKTNGKAILPLIKKDFIPKYTDEYDKDFFNKEIIKDFLQLNKRSHALALKRFCKYTSMSPEELILIGSPNNQNSLVKLALAVQPIKEFYESPEAKIKSSIGDGKGAFYAIRMGLRAFLTHNGINLPRNNVIISKYLGGKIVSHGKYAHIRLTDQEIIDARKYIIEKYGVQSDLFVVFMFGIETATRRGAILSVKLDFTQDEQKRWIKIKVFERKTKHMDEKYSKPTKFIFDLDLQNEILRRFNNGQKYLFKDDQYVRQETIEMDILKERTNPISEILNQIRDVYKFLGKTESYFTKRPFHSLRHIAAQYHLKKSDWDYYFVARLGNWTVIDELVKSYGEQPEEEFLKKYIKFETKKESE